MSKILCSPLELLSVLSASALLVPEAEPLLLLLLLPLLADELFLP